jgi:hypothetical protein
MTGIAESCYGTNSVLEQALAEAACDALVATPEGRLPHSFRGAEGLVSDGVALLSLDADAQPG